MYLNIHFQFESQTIKAEFSVVGISNILLSNVILLSTIYLLF